MTPETSHDRVKIESDGWVTQTQGRIEGVEGATEVSLVSGGDLEGSP